MLAIILAAHLYAVTVQPGDTLSGIAASHASSLAAVEAANPQITNPDFIVAGQTVNLTGAQPAQPTPAHSPSPSSISTATGSLSDVPGVPSSFAACVAYRESSDLADPAARGNAYGIIPASGYDGYHMTLAQQKQAFSALYAQYGTAPWTPSDGC